MKNSRRICGGTQRKYASKKVRPSGNTIAKEEERDSSDKSKTQEHLESYNLLSDDSAVI